MDRQDPTANTLIRTLNASDLRRLVDIDEKITGRSRTEWYRGRLERALGESDVRISLAAELDGILVGALMGSVHYGEFGQPEPVAVLDTILVDPAFGGRGVGRDLLDQLVKNLGALRIERLRTEIGWGEQSLLGFLAHEGFEPVPRLVLERGIR